MTRLPAESDDAPALATFNSRLQIAWRDSYELKTAAEGAWDRICALNEYSYHGPALFQQTSGERQLFIAWTGTNDTASLNTKRSFDGCTFDEDTKSTLWSEYSEYGPALARAGDSLYMAWVGGDPQHQLNIISTDRFGNWLPATKCILGESAAATPALAIDDRQSTLLMAWIDQYRHIRVGSLRTQAGVGTLSRAGLRQETRFPVRRQRMGRAW